MPVSQPGREAAWRTLEHNRSHTLPPHDENATFRLSWALLPSEDPTPTFVRRYSTLIPDDKTMADLPSRESSTCEARGTPTWMCPKDSTYYWSVIILREPTVVSANSPVAVPTLINPGGYKRADLCRDWRRYVEDRPGEHEGTIPPRGPTKDARGFFAETSSAA